MKANLAAASLALFLSLLIVAPAGADTRKKSSLLNDDPDVVYVEEFTDKKVELLVVKPGTVYATKKGGRKLGVLKVNTKLTLLGITEKAYKIRGTATHGGVSGWVSPNALGSKDKDFVANFKKVYDRQKIVRAMIANHEVAIGMSIEEVSASLGRPTKTKVRQTAKGKTGKWEFIQYEEQDHYTWVRDPLTGSVFRQYSHTTREELGKLVVEFENEIVTALEESENNGGGGDVKIVVPPLVIAW